MNHITYRNAKIDDCYTIAKLKGIVWNTTYKGIYSDATLSGYDISKNQATFEKIISNPDIELYVAVDNNKIVGCMTCGRPYKPFLHYQQEIGLLYILKEYQRQGIGKAFFDIARSQVRASGYSEFFVSVNKQNLNALRFYTSMGGKVIHTDETQIKLSYDITMSNLLE